MKRIYLYSVAGVVVLGGVGYFLFSGSAPKDSKYRTEKVSRGNIVVQVRATGTINPTKTVDVGSQVSGRIEKIYVDFNSHVKKGQIIAQIDSTFLYASVKQSEASLQRARAQVNNTQRTLKRTSDLFDKNLASQADLDAAKTAYESAVADLKAAEADLDRQQVNLWYAAIRAPIDGVVISRDVEVGQTVAASLQTPKLFGIANDLKLMQVEASVDEADIGQVKDGQEVTFTVDAYPDENFKGRVSQVRLDPIIVQNVVTYTVIIDVPNPQLKLRPGMTATVSILIDKRVNALRVPVLALRFQPPQEATGKPAGGEMMAAANTDTAKHQMGQQGSDRGGRQQWAGRRGEGQQHAGTDDGDSEARPGRVWVVNKDKSLSMRKVVVGISDNRYVEIVSGDLQDGDEAIVGMTVGDNGSNAQNNPFGPRGMMGGGGGPRR